jgi:hypothetical protein
VRDVVTTARTDLHSPGGRLLLGAAAGLLSVALGGCSCGNPPPARYPKSPEVAVGVSATPRCDSDTSLDFDHRLWDLPAALPPPFKLCRPGDTVTLVAPDQVKYVGADGGEIKLGPPQRSFQPGCA